MIRPRYLPDLIFAKLVSVSAFSHSLDPKEKSAVRKKVERWHLTTLRTKLIKIGAKVVRHDRYVIFQPAEVAVSRTLFAEILRLIDWRRPAPLSP